MSKASDYAERVNVDRPEFECDGRTVAHVGKDGDLSIKLGRVHAADVLALAEWLNNTFGEGSK